ncbi:hypothetical protein JO972_06825 [Verrucomicrobiaceae bacterium 5K15]|uniref:Uncharacterized protein n=1 Tax=Oceaniferula flava TaxID=2800421 RepID=A0AAE2SDR0_9BACT|nr:hypothetical protein [Oceaniferula flavus]MBK1854665.1 hypothetical protein [Oceaniferula flavus]MBM1135971.1 hypothetical protein [Oceaniferula flavus]
MACSFVSLIIRRVVNSIVGVLVNSPLEQDYGEASEKDIVRFEANYQLIAQIEYIDPRMARIFATIEGLSEHQFHQLHTRMWELPEDRRAEYLYHIKEPGRPEPVELRILLQKSSHHILYLHFQSSQAVIQSIQSLAPRQVEPVQQIHA